MTNKIKVKRGIASDNSTIILDSGEMFYDTSTKKLYIGDGVTQLGQLEPINSSGSGGGKIIQTTFGNYIENSLQGQIANTASLFVDRKITSIELKLRSNYAWAVVPNEGITINGTLVTNPVANSVMLYSTNQGVANSWSAAKINFGSIAKFYANAYAEANCDVTLVGNLNATPLSTSNFNFSTHQLNADPMTFGDSNYITCTYAQLSYNNFVEVGFYKDGSVNSNLDTGFIIIKEEDMEDGFTIYDENNNVVYTKPIEEVI